MIQRALHSGMFPDREPRTKEELLNITRLLETSELLKTKQDHTIIYSKLGTSSSIVVNSEHTKKINVFSFHGNAEDVYKSNDRNLLIGHVMIDNFLALNKDDNNNKFIEVELYNIGYPIIDDYEKNADEIIYAFSEELLESWCTDIYEFMLPKLSDPDCVNIFVGYSIGTGFVTKLLSTISSDGFPPDHVLLIAPISSIDELVFSQYYYISVFKTLFWSTRYNYFDLNRDLLIFRSRFSLTSIVAWCGLNDSVYHICGKFIRELAERGLLTTIEYKSIGHNEFGTRDVIEEIIGKFYQKYMHESLATLFDVSALTPGVTPENKQM